ncbi:hypothetical protein FSP39_019416 [Pinctada imbricata]|uniref:C2H2-type domain-containing protein n=1 Tax=Pinctada imbricata TaxID=66713 RepID=A0AA88YEY9_PINIB|nr:hypothetical protein FSP39_019416 [Pinctada imbricata]
MQLFANASAKLSDDVLEILQSKCSEIETLCAENDVLIQRSDQVKSEFEVTGDFTNLINLYNRLAEHLESNFRITVNQYEVRKKQSVHVSECIDHPQSVQIPECKSNEMEESAAAKCVPTPIIYEFPSVSLENIQNSKLENKNHCSANCETLKGEHAKDGHDCETIQKTSSNNRKLRQKRNQLRKSKTIKYVKLNRKASANERLQINLVSSRSEKLKNIAEIAEQRNDNEQNKPQCEDLKSNKNGKKEGVCHSVKVKKIYGKRKGPADESKFLKISKERNQSKDAEEQSEHNFRQIRQKEVETNNRDEPLETENQLPENDKDKPLQCTQCEKHFKSSRQLSRHEKQHCNPTYCCKKCGKLYKSLKSYQDHERSHEEGYVKPEFVCRDCGKAFSTKYVLQNHVKSEHLGMKKSYLCPTCGKSFTQKNSYLLHANVHLGIRPFICEICGDSFPYEKSLKEHKYMHDDIRRFKCKECGKGFRQPSALHTHMKVHKDSREHLCGTCGKGFTQKQALSRHEGFILVINLSHVTCVAGHSLTLLLSGDICLWCIRCHKVTGEQR